MSSRRRRATSETAASGCASGYDLAGVDHAHLFNQVEETVDLMEHAIAFTRLQFEPGQIGDACDIVGVE